MLSVDESTGSSFTFDSMQWDQERWRRSLVEFGAFMEPVVAKLGRSERREGAALYVQGLLMPGERKSIEPMAARLGADKQKLQQFMADSPWDAEQVWEAIRREIVPVMEPLTAWIVDETGWLKQGDKTVGVSHQYCGAVGKQANCQVSVEVVVSDGEIAAPVAGQLYLPQNWVNDQARREAAGVPAELVFETKPQIALGLLRKVVAAGVSPAPVLGDEVYGAAGEMRRGLRELGLEYFLNASGAWSAWTERVKTRRGRKHWGVAQGQPKASSLKAVSENVPDKRWRMASWRTADESQRTTRVAWLPVWVLSDLDQQTGDWPQSWLVVDWPEGAAEPYHLYLASLRREPTAARCLRLSRGRFPVEQFFQRDKADLGLDHYEGRSWRGFHHHLALAAVAYLFVTAIYLRSKKNFWCYVGTGIARDSAVVGAIDRMLSMLPDEIHSILR